jgi:hypothetical protein
MARDKSPDRNPFERLGDRFRFEAVVAGERLSAARPDPQPRAFHFLDRSSDVSAAIRRLVQTSRMTAIRLRQAHR